MIQIYVTFLAFDYTFPLLGEVSYMAQVPIEKENFPWL